MGVGNNTYLATYINFKKRDIFMKTFAIFILIVQLAWACQQAVAMKLTVEIKPKLDPLAESQVSPGKIGSTRQSYLDHHPHPSVGQFRQLETESYPHRGVDTEVPTKRKIIHME